MRKVLQFINAAGQWGWPSVLGTAIFIVISIWEHVRDKALASYVFMLLAAVVFCAGAFKAWLEERKKYEIEKAKHDNPNLELGIVSILTQYVPAANVTGVCFAGVLVNRGSPSIAVGWKVRYQSPSIDLTVGFVSPVEDEIEWTETAGRKLILKRDEMLPARTLAAIERGHSRHGRVIFEIPGAREDEIYSGAAMMWIGCTDTTGRLCQASFKTDPAHRHQTLQLFPDEKTKATDQSKPLSPPKTKG